MALSNSLPLPMHLDISVPREISIPRSYPFSSSSSSLSSFPSSSSYSTPLTHSKGFNPLPAKRLQKFINKATPESETNLAADAFTQFKHLLLPVTDTNPYLSEGTRQAAATTAALANKYGSDITVLVIAEKPKESLPEYETQLSSIRWHLSEGGFQEFCLIEQLGSGSKPPTAVIGEVADELSSDLVVISMDSVHSKHVDANLLAEFIPCPVLLLPL
ncbi:hypothetical protein MKW98_001115 [Papaver atlanticum]|uniref:Universal stress protein n=1 Tax=Papaver atlanticum TaxID=357466 RepID=A0AAD4XKW7_9MAGN|nr:hypothetical protein MKW98_001115 [Papaver atlanticum]